MSQRLDLNNGNCSISFLSENGILTVKRIPKTKRCVKLISAGLYFVPMITFMLLILYMVYALITDLPPIANQEDYWFILFFFIFLVALGLTAGIPGQKELYPSICTLDHNKYSLIEVLGRGKIQLNKRKPSLFLQIAEDRTKGFVLAGEIRIQRKRKIFPWDNHVPLFRNVSFGSSPKKARKNAHMIKEFLLKNEPSLFEKIIIDDLTLVGRTPIFVFWIKKIIKSRIS